MAKVYLNKAISAHKEYIKHLLGRMDNFRKMTYTLREKGNEPKLLANYENMRVHSVNIDHTCKQREDRLKDILTCYKFQSSQDMKLGDLEKAEMTLPELTEQERDRPPPGWASLNAALEKPKTRPVIRISHTPDSQSVQPLKRCLSCWPSWK